MGEMNALEAEIARRTTQGWEIVSREPSQVQMRRLKHFSFLWAFLWFLVFGVGLFFYLIWHWAKRDRYAYLRLEGDRLVVAESRGFLGALFAPLATYFKWAARRERTWTKALALGGPVAAVAVAIVVISATASGGGGDEEQAEAGTQPTTATIGDTVVPKGSDPASLSLTLLSCLLSAVAVDGPYYIDGYYTFTAKPGMKFVILRYRFTNGGVRQYDTPYLDTGEVMTSPKGYSYRVWSPPLGAVSVEYSPRTSTKEEVDSLGGDAGAFKTLMPEESTTGRAVFEIPADMAPVEASLASVPAKIALAGHCL